MTYDDVGFSFVQMLREALVPPASDPNMRTCDCPIVWADEPTMKMSQVHRYNCPVGIRERRPAAQSGETKKGDGR